MNTEEVAQNRKRYVRALRQSKNQCYGQLFDIKDGKQCACAVGVGIRAFFGIATEDEMERRTGDEMDYYERFCQMIDIPVMDSHGLDSEYIWRLNDRNQWTLKRIGDHLARKWDL